MALWGGRFEKGVDAFTQEFGASLEVDKAMAQQDIAGSRAHAKMLAEQGIISEADQQAIDAGLADISGQIANGDFAWDVNDEDIHMAVEGALTRNIGTPGARLHTGRSRNDQVATDIRLYAKELCSHLMEGNRSLRRVFLDVAEKNMGVVMPGYTHLQHAQPVLFSHHMLAYFWMFTRDYTRLAAACDAADANPLGAAALAGTTYPLDRQRTTELLGFDHAIPNSLDAVSDRDYLLDLEYACSVSMMHLSRLCEEIVLWSSTEFGFVTLSDSHRLLHHAAEEEPRLCRAYPRQVRPRLRRSHGASYHDEVAAAGVQQGPPGVQGGSDGRRKDALRLHRDRRRHARDHAG